MTQPVTLWEAVLGKFLAAWIFHGARTGPHLSAVDHRETTSAARINGTIFAAYVGSLLLAGRLFSRSARACRPSPATRWWPSSWGVVACFLFLLAGFPLVLDVFPAGGAPQVLVDAVPRRYRSSLTTSRSPRASSTYADLLYFGMLIAFFLLATPRSLSNCVKPTSRKVLRI